jgi:hypothetical protein
MHPNSAELPEFWEENWYDNIETKPVETIGKQKALTCSVLKRLLRAYRISKGNTIVPFEKGGA